VLLNSSISSANRKHIKPFSVDINYTYLTSYILDRGFEGKPWRLIEEIERSLDKETAEQFCKFYAADFARTYRNITETKDWISMYELEDPIHYEYGNLAWHIFLLLKTQGIYRSNLNWSDY
jgi:hypothetical protein